MYRLSDGLDEFTPILERSIDTRFDTFEVFCLKNIFSLKGVVLYNISSENEVDLDARIELARKQILAVLFIHPGPLCQAEAAQAQVLQILKSVIDSFKALCPQRLLFRSVPSQCFRCSHAGAHAGAPSTNQSHAGLDYLRRMETGRPDRTPCPL